MKNENEIIDVVLLMGGSGTGKTYLASVLMAMAKGRFHQVVSATTRPLRQGEVEGVDYFKMTEEEFLSTEFVESAKFGSAHYGTPKSEFYKGKDLVHVLEPDGAKQIMEKFKDDPLYNIKTVLIDLPYDICRNNLLKSIEEEKEQLTSKEELSTEETARLSEIEEYIAKCEKRLSRDEKDSVKGRIETNGITPDVTITEFQDGKIWAEKVFDVL